MMNQFAVVVVLLVMVEVFAVMEGVVARKNMQSIAQHIRLDTKSRSVVGFVVDHFASAYLFNLINTNLSGNKRPREIGEIEMIELKKQRIKKGVMVPDCFYVWAPEKGREVIVWLNKDGDGIIQHDSMDQEDHWYFEHNLIGFIYGPFTLAKNISPPNKH